jgi:hypothetical protein
MRLTEGHGGRRDTLQIFSIKIVAIRGGLQWPLDVFGMVTARDVADNRKRNIIYSRTRNNCETIMEEVINYLCIFLLLFIMFSVHCGWTHVVDLSLIIITLACSIPI